MLAGRKDNGFQPQSTPKAHPIFGTRAPWATPHPSARNYVHYPPTLWMPSLGRLVNGDVDAVRPRTQRRGPRTDPKSIDGREGEMRYFRAPSPYPSRGRICMEDGGDNEDEEKHKDENEDEQKDEQEDEQEGEEMGSSKKEAEEKDDNEKRDKEREEEEETGNNEKKDVEKNDEKQEEEKEQKEDNKVGEANAHHYIHDDLPYGAQIAPSVSEGTYQDSITRTTTKSDWTIDFNSSLMVESEEKSVKKKGLRGVLKKFAGKAKKASKVKAKAAWIKTCMGWD
ncbi:hypothetical protein F4780DRAFT_796714 [Xylariomycetidae sp. FL0641]|nr:hypothetical protein F4780DRAFT_796714 [Xylariomycetidae sp. FL0641]